MTKIIGFSILFTIFGGLFYMTADMLGYKGAFILWSAAIGLTILVGIACFLIEMG